MHHFVRVHVERGGFACHSCLSEFPDERYMEIEDWGRKLCLPCAQTLGGKMKEIAALHESEKSAKTQSDLWR